MDEDNATVFFEHEIRATGEIGLVQSEAVAESVDEAADGDFRSGIFGADAGHVAGALFWRVDVGHEWSFVGGCEGAPVNGFSGEFCGIAGEF